MKNFTSKDNFDICMVLVNSDEEESKIKVLQFKRIDNDI